MDSPDDTARSARKLTWFFGELEKRAVLVGDEVVPIVRHLITMLLLARIEANDFLKRLMVLLQSQPPQGTLVQNLRAQLQVLHRNNLQSCVLRFLIEHRWKCPSEQVKVSRKRDSHELDLQANPARATKVRKTVLKNELLAAKGLAAQPSAT